MCETARGRSSENIICSCTLKLQERMAGCERGPCCLARGLVHPTCQSNEALKTIVFKAYFSWLIVWECNCTEKYLVSVLIFPLWSPGVNTQEIIPASGPWTMSMNFFQKSGSVPSLWQFAWESCSVYHHACSPQPGAGPFLPWEQAGSDSTHSRSQRSCNLRLLLPVTGNWKAKVRRKYNCIWICRAMRMQTVHRGFSVTVSSGIFSDPEGRRLID